LDTKRMAAGPRAVAVAAEVVAAGGIVAVPTDTVYGLCSDPRSDAAVQRLFEVKDREAKPVPLLCASPSVAAGLVEFNASSSRLAERYWPGALTIVAPARKGTGLSRLLDQGTGHLGVRVPKSDVCMSLAAKVGGAVTGTSANLSGQPSCRTASEVIAALDGRIQLVVDGGTLRSRESTVVRVTGETVEVLREGSVRIKGGQLRP
jgi:L-threonylcarbamoyladenylate synthase